MKLLPPEILGPVSTCSKKVRIRGNIVGATIHILANMNEIATHDNASKFDDSYDLDVALQEGVSITVFQSFDGEKSDFGLPVNVQSVPAQPSSLTVESTLYECGRAIWTTGGVPGAKVEGRIGTQLAGSGEVLAGISAIKYDPVLGANQSMSLKQTTCANASLIQSSPASIVPPSPIPVPTIHGPLIECQNTITIRNVLDGAFVELYRNEILEKTFTFFLPSEWHRIDALKEGDLIEVRQGFRCKKESPTLESFSSKVSAIVESTDAMKAPKILGTPCPGTTYLTLTKLIIGARLHLLVDGQEWGQTDIASEQYTFTVPPLPAGGEIKAYMTLCKKKSPAATLMVSKKANTPDGCKVSDLYQCASYVYVRVGGSSGNYLLVITNKLGQHISAYHNLIGFNKLVPVSPSLIAGDEITVNVLGCGGKWEKYGPFPVSAGSPPPPVFKEPIESGYLSVQVNSQHAGALIDIFVNDIWQGKAISVGNLAPTIIGLPQELQTGDSVFGTHTLCGKTGKPSKTIEVVIPKPEKPILISPASDAVGVEIQPQFKWEDPGMNQENSAKSFGLIVRRNNTEVINTTTMSSPLLSPAVLDYSTEYEWQVRSINNTGYQVSFPWSRFTTRAAPPPQEANLMFEPPITISPPNIPRNTPLTLSIIVFNSGNIASDEYTVVFRMAYNSLGDGGLIDQKEATFSSIDAGDSVSITSVPVEIPTGTIRIDVFLIVDGVQVDSVFRVV